MRDFRQIKLPTLFGLMLGPVARQCSKTAEDSRDEAQVAGGGGGGGILVKNSSENFPKKIPRQKLTPRKSHSEFPSRKNF